MSMAWMPLSTDCRYGVLVLCLLVFIAFQRTCDGRPQNPYEKYEEERMHILAWEKKMAVGGEMVLTPKEETVNQILMEHKQAEINASLYKGKPFPPRLHFFRAKELIENSSVFKLIKKMPKGSALHVHDISVVSLDWVVKNVTYRANCYMCYKKPSGLSLKFFAKPPQDPNCTWTLVSDNRKKSSDPSTFDQWLYNNMSLIVPDPATAYSTENGVWNAFESALHTVSDLILYAPVYRDYVYQSLKEYTEDNVQYMEIRALLLPTYNLDGSLNPPIWTLELYRNVSRQFVQDHRADSSGLKLIYCGLRRNSPGTVEKSIKQALSFWKMFPDFLVGFDLVGQEDKGHPLLYFINQLLNQTTAEKLPVPYFFHAGETNWQGTSVDDNLIDAILMNTTRIGHGFALVKHPVVMEAVKSRGIAIEVNPISNQVLELVDDLRDHPGSVFLANNLPVVISSDDGAVWGVKGLSYDFYQAFMGLSGANSDLTLLKQLALNSIQYSAMSPQEKKAALKLWEAKWEKFINDVWEQYEVPKNKI